MSSLYAYPIAAFARIVAENPLLQTVYGNDAIDFANKIVEMVDFFLPQLHEQRVGDFIEARLMHLEEYRNRPTQAECDKAYDDALKADPGNKSRWDGQHRDCNRLRRVAGGDAPHNYNLTFSMVLIELSRVLDSPFYQQSPKRSSDAERFRFFLPLYVSRQQRYFVNRLAPVDLEDIGLPCRGKLCWHYMDNPHRRPRPEDVDHGCMDMNYVGVFLHNRARLNVAAKRSHEPLAFTRSHLRGIARTFVENVTGGTNFNSDINGGEPKLPYSADNSRCEGWLELTRADARVYQACHDMSLRIVGGQQPNLHMGAHSSLLMNKQFLPPP